MNSKQWAWCFKPLVDDLKKWIQFFNLLKIKGIEEKEKYQLA
jgi:hypothetical protein